jgi:hypothetical protein
MAEENYILNVKGYIFTNIHIALMGCIMVGDVVAF